MIINLSHAQVKLIQELLLKERRKVAIDAHMYEHGFTYPHYHNMNERKKMIMSLEHKLQHPEQGVLWNEVSK